MGLEILQEDFDEDTYARFGLRLQDNLDALALLLQRPGFGEGDITVGVELECSLVDGGLRPAPVNEQVLATLGDPGYTVELNRYNLEFNGAPVPLGRASFGQVRAQLQGAVERIRTAAAAAGARPVLVGILPTLTASHLGLAAMTPRPRYRALNAGILRQRQRPLRIHINGVEPLDLDAADVTLEGANTSLQFHLRVPPGRFARVYNAAQLACAPVLALATNAPLVLGHRLWSESRIAVFKQSVDDRDADAFARRRAPRVCFGTGWLRHGALDYFSETARLHAPLIPVCGDEDPVALARAGDVPGLPELRLHNGTVWRWNRAVYDPAGDGQLRIEFRMLPSGPTVSDMVANLGFLLGLCLALADGPTDPGRHFPFDAAHDNFYRAAQSGLDAVLTWPDGAGGMTRHAAPELIARLLPLAAAGLGQAGVDPAEIDEMQAVLAERLRSRQTGSTWQLRQLARHDARLDRAAALGAMLADYIEHSDLGHPVAQWGRDS